MLGVIGLNGIVCSQVGLPGGLGLLRFSGVTVQVCVGPSVCWA